jgi:chlorophyll synthase
VKNRFRYKERLATVTTQLNHFLPYFPVWQREVPVKIGINLQSFDEIFTNGLQSWLDALISKPLRSTSEWQLSGCMNGMIKKIASIFLNHIDAWGVALICSALAVVVHGAISVQTILLIAAISSGYWFAFAVNDYYDAPFDGLDGDKARHNIFVEQSGKTGGKWRVFLVFGLISMLLFLPFLQFGLVGVLLYGLSLFVVWAYSAPPLRLKNRPGTDLLIHALFVETYPYALCLILLGVEWSGLDRFILSITFLGSLAAQLEQQVRDYDLDVQTGRTFATIIGRRPAYLLLQLTTVVTVLVALIHWLRGDVPAYLVPIGLIALPSLVHRLLRGPHVHRSQWVVYLSAVAGLLYVAGVFIYFAMRDGNW